jgi:predicted Zn-dependent protease
MPSCQPVPVTGRTQLHLIPDTQMLALSFESYRKILEKNKVIEEGTNLEKVRRVGKQIQNSVEIFFHSRKMDNFLKNYKWEFNLIEDSIASAWAMPGGKIGVCTGMLPLIKNDTGLAIVLGHEIGHVVAKHGDERMCQALVVELGGVTLSSALAENPDLTCKFAHASFGLGAEDGVLLPYSSLQESEADQLGLIFMAMAGYNPQSAINFWENMVLKEENTFPEYLSTHPSDKRRINSMRRKIPHIMKYLKK